MTTTDIVERLRAADPAANADTPDIDRLHHLVQTRRIEPGPGPRFRRRRLVTVGIATGVLAAGAAAGVALRDRTPVQALTCAYMDTTVVIGSVSSNPVADCTATLPTDQPLGIYTSEDGSAVVVAPDQQTASRAVTVPVFLAEEFQADLATIELRMALEDIAVWADACTQPGHARELAQSTLDRLNLVGWTISDVQGEGSCTYAHANIDQQTIGLTASDPAGNHPVFDELIELSQEIHDDVQQTCADAQQARAIVEGLLSGTDHAETTLITVNLDPSAECARVYTNAYGRYEITVFGP